MVRTSIEGFQVSFPALVQFFIFMGCESVDFPFQIVSFVHGFFFFFYKLSLYLGPISNGPWPQRVEPNLGFILQSQRKKF